MSSESTLDALGMVNYRLEELFSLRESPTVQTRGVPNYEIFNLDPLVASPKFGRFRNKGPYLNGIVPVRAVLHKPTTQPDIYFMHLAVHAGERIFAQTINFHLQEHRLVFSGILKSCGMDDWKITT